MGATINLACRDIQQFELMTLSRISLKLHTYEVLYNPREITGARFYVLNPRLCFLKFNLVNRCQVIRNTKTCEIFLKPGYLARFASIYYPVELVCKRDVFFFFYFVQNLACVKVRTELDSCEDLEKTGEG